MRLADVKNLNYTVNYQIFTTYHVIIIFSPPPLSPGASIEAVETQLPLRQLVRQLPRTYLRVVIF
jgi:hypothetical protein